MPNEAKWDALVRMSLGENEDGDYDSIIYAYTKIQRLEEDLRVANRELMAIAHEKPRPIEFYEDDGTLRRLVWNEGDSSVGIWAGYVPDDGVSLQDFEDTINKQQTELRKICGELGEFRTEGDNTAVDKIRFLRKDYEKQISTYKKEDQRIRMKLWLLHGCGIHILYGDDGEMQCNSCLLDFLRDPWKKILDKIDDNALRRIYINTEKE